MYQPICLVTQVIMKTLPLHLYLLHWFTVERKSRNPRKMTSRAIHDIQAVGAWVTVPIFTFVTCHSLHVHQSFDCRTVYKASSRPVVVNIFRHKAAHTRLKASLHNFCELSYTPFQRLTYLLRHLPSSRGQWGWGSSQAGTSLSLTLSLSAYRLTPQSGVMSLQNAFKGAMSIQGAQTPWFRITDLDNHSSLQRVSKNDHTPHHIQN